MTAKEARAAIQTILGVVPDGDIGDITNAAYDELAIARPASLWPAPFEGQVPHSGLASSFADPADIRAFKRCKALGKTDQEAFKVGDNGIGKWGDATTAPVPMCALPPEDWRPFGALARGKLVLVRANGREVICQLRDTMPAKKNIKNGAIIDLNEAAWKALGRKPPVMLPATWQWV